MSDVAPEHSAATAPHHEEKAAESELHRPLPKLFHDGEAGAEMQDMELKMDGPDKEFDFGVDDSLDGPEGASSASAKKGKQLKSKQKDADLPMVPEQEAAAQNNKRKFERMCSICMTVPAINKFLFCKPCKRDVQACRADAEKDGRLADWTRLTKTEEGLRHLILHYQKTCPSRGQGIRRDSFDWASYTKKIFTTKQNITGTLEAYMDWIEYEKHALSKGNTSKEAFEQWQAWETSNHDHDFRGRKDYEKRFAVPIQDYIRRETVTGEKEDKLLTGWLQLDTCHWECCFLFAVKEISHGSKVKKGREAEQMLEGCAAMIRRAK
ncbi:MIP, partial [Symbiodinium sp. CCMP2456]